MFWALCPISINYYLLRMQLIFTRQAHTTLPLLTQGRHVTPLWDCAGRRQSVAVGKGTMSKFTRGPWQRIKDEPPHIHLAVAFVGD